MTAAVARATARFCHRMQGVGRNSFSVGSLDSVLHLGRRRSGVTLITSETRPRSNMQKQKNDLLDKEQKTRLVVLKPSKSPRLR